MKRQLVIRWDFMELMITSIFDLAIIFAIWKVYQYNKLDLKAVEYVSQQSNREYCEIKKLMISVSGKIEKQSVRSKILEKFAERAWNSANAAALGVVALQKAQALKPRIRSYNQVIHDQVAEKKLDGLFGDDARFDYLEPFATDDEQEVIDKLRKQTAKM